EPANVALGIQGPFQQRLRVPFAPVRGIEKIAAVHVNRPGEARNRVGHGVDDVVSEGLSILFASAAPQSAMNWSRSNIVSACRFGKVVVFDLNRGPKQKPSTPRFHATKITPPSDRTRARPARGCGRAGPNPRACPRSVRPPPAPARAAWRNRRRG